MREKALPLEAMSTEDALDALEAVGHDFFIYKDAADAAVKVLYRRK